jgi:hypothetical protein
MWNYLQLAHTVGPAVHPARPAIPDASPAMPDAPRPPVLPGAGLF